jgi:hypothetical protein
MSSAQQELTRNWAISLAIIRPPSNMSLSPGTRIGPYEVVSMIGAGGMGEVYRARDGRLGRMVAIKFTAATRPRPPTTRLYTNGRAVRCGLESPSDLQRACRRLFRVPELPRPGVLGWRIARAANRTRSLPLDELFSVCECNPVVRGLLDRPEPHRISPQNCEKADRLAWLSECDSVLPIYSDAEQAALLAGNRRDAMHAKFGRPRNQMQPLPLPDISEQIGADLGSAATNAAEVRSGVDVQPTTIQTPGTKTCLADQLFLLPLLLPLVPPRALFLSPAPRPRLVSLPFSPRVWRSS